MADLQRMVASCYSAIQRDLGDHVPCEFIGAKCFYLIFPKTRLLSEIPARQRHNLKLEQALKKSVTVKLADPQGRNGVAESRSHWLAYVSPQLFRCCAS